MTTQSDDTAEKAELRKRIEYQVACEERAHRIVERLIDNPITEEMLCNSLQYITQSHYSDIVEERAVSKLCGYPLCPNDLGNVSKQKYMISTKTNKVYDLEARKNFCNGKCFKASKHLETQISNVPVWTRKSLPPVKFDLLPLDSKIGKLGDEVLVSKSAEIKEDVNKLEKLDKYYEDLEKKKHQNVESKQLNIEGSQKIDHNQESKLDDSARDIKEKKDSINVLSDRLQNVDVSDQCGRGEGDIQADKMLADSAVSGDVNIGDKPDSGVKGFNEQHGLKSQKNSTKSEKSSGKSKKVDKSKTDYLMQLLDRRKALLSKMVDDQEKADTKSANKQPNLNNDNENIKPDVCEKDSGTNDAMLNEASVSGKICKSENDSLICDSNNSSDGIDLNKCTATEDTVKQEACDVRDICKDPLALNRGVCSLSVKEKDLAGKSDQFTTIPNKCIEEIPNELTEVDDDVSDAGKLTKVPSKKKVGSTMELICEGVRCWITEQTAEYLKDNADDSEKTELKLGKPEFEKQYKALIAKVDAEEKDFDALLGEESMENDFKNQAVAPLPHFDVLKEELMDNQKRVEQFMKGSFVYKVTEKSVDLKKDGKDGGAVLPTVDRYDQLVIRQKIILERVSKVLPDILSPLHLLVQEVFT